jgi:hypothetical protein
MPASPALRAALAVGALLVPCATPSPAAAAPTVTDAGLPKPRLPFRRRKAEPPAPKPAQAAAAKADSAPGAEAARRGFADSWFWGAKAGVQRFGTTSEGHVAAPSVGADWLVTRSSAALLVGFDQALFERTAILPAQDDTSRGTAVRMRNARRFSATLLATPRSFGPVRPYGGIGLALELIDGALPQGMSTTSGQRAPEQELIDDLASRTTLLLLGGAQAQFGRAAVFLQGSVSPASTSRSLWNYGRPMLLEAGVRLNLADAIEKL